MVVVLGGGVAVPARDASSTQSDRLDEVPVIATPAGALSGERRSVNASDRVGADTRPLADRGQIAGMCQHPENLVLKRAAPMTSGWSLRADCNASAEVDASFTTSRLESLASNR